MGSMPDIGNDEVQGSHGVRDSPKNRLKPYRAKG